MEYPLEVTKEQYLKDKELFLSGKESLPIYFKKLAYNYFISEMLKKGIDYREKLSFNKCIQLLKVYVNIPTILGNMLLPDCDEEFNNRCISEIIIKNFDTNYNK